MIKKSRLSFRISDPLNEDIEKMVVLKRDVRDRSDLGNQSVEFFLDLIEEKAFEQQVYLNAILKIASKAGKEDLPEIEEIKSKLAWLEHVAQDPIAASIEATKLAK